MRISTNLELIKVKVKTNPNLELDSEDKLFTYLKLDITVNRRTKTILLDTNGNKNKVSFTQNNKLLTRTARHYINFGTEFEEVYVTIEGKSLYISTKNLI